MDGMPRIRALIVDDERPGRDNLRLALAAFPGWQVVAECASAREARDALQGTAVDVAFIDMQMPGEGGLDLARSLCTEGSPPLLVFVTAYSRYAVEAFEVHALDYLLKPLDDERLGQALARAEAQLGEPRNEGYMSAVRACAEETRNTRAGIPPPYLSRVVVRSVGKHEVVEFDDVLAISSAGNYVELQLGHRQVLHRVPLSRLEPRLDPARFLRVHRTAIVRRDRIRSLQVVSDGAYRIGLEGGGDVPVSARYVAAVRDAMAGAGG